MLTCSDIIRSFIPLCSDLMVTSLKEDKQALLRDVAQAVEAYEYGRLSEAERLIKELQSHEGAEGWSASLAEALDHFWSHPHPAPAELIAARAALWAIINDNDWGAHPHTIALEFFEEYPDAS